MTSEDKSFETVLQRIKSRGYWRIHLFPEAPELKRVDFKDAMQLLSRASVSLRGISYPTVPEGERKNAEAYVRGDHLEAWADYSGHKEVWQFYLTGQFVHFRDVWEDWISEDPWISQTSHWKDVPAGKYLDFVGTTLLVTEVFLFIKNLVGSSLYTSPVTLELGLANTRNRILTTFEPRHLSREYRTRSDTISMEPRTFVLNEIRDRYLDLAREYVMRIFEQFDWQDPSEEVIREDQKRLLARRL